MTNDMEKREDVIVKITNMIIDFGDGETEFETRDIEALLHIISDLQSKLELSESLVTDYRSKLDEAKDEIARLRQLPSAIIVDGIVKQRNYKCLQVIT